MLVAFTQAMGSDFNVSQVNSTFDLIDFDKSNKLSYTEFLSASMSTEQLTDAKLRKLFGYLDLKFTEELDVETLLRHFKRQGKNFIEADVERMFEEVGLQADEKITFEKFKKIV